MKKKIIKIFSPLLLLVPFPVYAEEQTAEANREITASGMSGILVSFVYLAAVLALIYVVLLLIDRYAKKHNGNGEQSKTQEENAADKAPVQNTENDGSTNEDNKRDE